MQAHSQNAYFPMFVSRGALEKEKEHVKASPPRWRG